MVVVVVDVCNRNDMVRPDTSSYVYACINMYAVTAVRCLNASTVSGCCLNHIYLKMRAVSTIYQK